MDKKELQVENGNFTRIINPVIEALIKVPFKGCELAVVIFVIRRTYGHQKTVDIISLSQFEKNLCRSRPTIIRAINNLLESRILEVVNTSLLGRSFKLNKYYKNWNIEVVNTGLPLVKRRGSLLVNTGLHTKENTKENISHIPSEVGPVSTKNQTMYREDLRRFSDEYEPVVDAETGMPVAGKPKNRLDRKYRDLLKWAAKERGAGFVNIPKQYAAMKKMRVAGITLKAVQDRWSEMGNEQFWRDKGYDFTDVANSFDKRR